MDSSKSFLSLFSLVLLLGLISSATATATATTNVVGASKQRHAFLGSYTPIEDLKDPYVLGIANFSVTVHNEYGPDNLAFVKVSSGEKQVVAGFNYKLTIFATKPGEAGNYYQAVVYDKAGAKSWTLTSFVKLYKLV